MERPSIIIYSVRQNEGGTRSWQKMRKRRSERELSEYGIIYLSGEINASNAETVCKEIIEHNIKGDASQIQMIINSPGGTCSAGFSIIDIME